jgi:hypothetical protein
MKIENQIINHEVIHDENWKSINHEVIQDENWKSNS